MNRRVIAYAVVFGLFAFVSFVVLNWYIHRAVPKYDPYDKASLSRAVETQLLYPGMNILWRDIILANGTSSFSEQYMMIGALPKGVTLKQYEEYVQSQIKDANWKVSRQSPESFEVTRGNWDDLPFAHVTADVNIPTGTLNNVSGALGKELGHEVILNTLEEQSWLSKDGGVVVLVDLAIDGIDHYYPQPTSPLHPIKDLFPKFK